MDVFFNLLPVKVALTKLMDVWLPGELGVQDIALDKALDRVLAYNVISTVDVPPFDRSTVDGYAVRAADTFGATDGLPAFIEIVESILMGQTPVKELRIGEASRIATGGMLPKGTDAVVMVEYTEIIDEQTIAVMNPVAPGENVIYQGEDIKDTSILLPAGRRLRPADLGALAAIGEVRVRVRRKPKVEIISTGDEIVPPEIVPASGQVRDINSYSLAAAVQRAGGEPQLKGLVKDRFEDVETAVQNSLAESDIVVVSGGSSVGTKDVVASVLAKLGAPGVLVHGVAIRPGKPLLMAVNDNKPVFGLPGHPVSAMVTFDLFVRPAIEKLLGSGPGLRPSVYARLARNLASTTGREDYVRVRLLAGESGPVAEPILGKSGLISTLAQADGTIVIPPDKEGLLAGEEVEVYPL